jgi:nitroreductase/NAD-dependent dihydropyrimidine dehydrogenase PreA subunit
VAGVDWSWASGRAKRDDKETTVDEEKRLLERIKREVLYGHDIAPPSVDIDKCKGCGHCVKVCGPLVFELREQKSLVAHGERCYACGHCWAVCPEEAVTQQEAVTATSLRPGPKPAVAPENLQLLLRERRSLRLFKDTPVSREQLATIIEAGRYAPTGSNRQDVSYIVLSGQEKVAVLRSMVEAFLDKMTKGLRNPAVALFLRLRMGRLGVDVMRYYSSSYEVSAHMTPEAKKSGAYFPLPFGQAVIITHARSFDQVAQSNCSMALYNCSLMAHSLGLASCFLGFVPITVNTDKGVRERLGVPKENQVYGAMVVGYPGMKYRRLIERKTPDIAWL